MKPFVCLHERTRNRRHFFWMLHKFHSFLCHRVCEGSCKCYKQSVDLYLAVFVYFVLSIVPVVGCRLGLFHLGGFLSCLHFLVHSVVAKLVVSKNCPKLVHKYLQNYSKTQYHKKLKMSHKVARNLFSDKKPQ